MGERYPDTVEVGGSIPPAPTKTILLIGGTIGIRRSKLPTRSDDTARVNDQINVLEVRVIDGEGGQLGIMSIEEALEQSEEAGMDLVEVSPKANPPVCRMMDFGKFKYQQSKKQHAARQNQKTIHLKEVKMKPKIEEHDFQFKVRNALRFLEEGDKVKVNIMFFGRMMAHKDLGLVLMEKFENAIGEAGIVEQPVCNEGRSMFMIMAPPKKKL